MHAAYRPSDYKDKLDAARNEMDRLSVIIKNEHEPRAVECRWIDDWEHNMRRCVRQDSGEVVDEHAIPDSSTARSTACPQPTVVRSR